MSDPMTNMEIEDVLSSIRRLVSEDNRPAPRPESPLSAAMAMEPVGKLVLTPAFRVTEPENPPDEPVKRFEPDAAELAINAGTPGDEPPEVMDFSVVEDLSPDGLGESQTVFDAEAIIAAVEPGDVLAEAPEDDWDNGTAGAHFTMPSMAAGRLLADSPPSVAEPDPVAPMRRLHLGLSEGIEDPAEPVWADAALHIPEPQSAETVTEPEPAEGSGSLFAEVEETVLDEAMLRELVIEMIRQELQGALGERITRNVRKLVRAEIHRALASREFE